MYMASPVQSKDYVGQRSAVKMSKVLLLIMSVCLVCVAGEKCEPDCP